MVLKKVVYIKNLNKYSIDQISKVLQLTIKGKFIEYHIATPAWSPIIS